MKNLKIFLLIFFIPFFGIAQQLNGIWTGVLSNDSSTVRRDQSFEIALTEYKGKVMGYAYSTFIVNDTLYYIVKRVKGNVTGDICEVEDDEVITHNFPQKPEKRVYVTYTLRRNNNDSTWTLDGNWKTNQTKRYYAITGQVDAQEEKDLSKSKLYEHLGDLKLQETLVLNKPQEKKIPPDTKTSVAKNKPGTEKKDPEKKSGSDIAKSEVSPDPQLNGVALNNEQKKPNNVIVEKVKPDPVAVNSQPEKKSEPVVTKNETKLPDTKTNVSVINNPPIQNDKNVAAVSESKQPEKKTEPVVTKTETNLPDTKTNLAVINNPPIQNDKNVTAATESKQAEKKTEPVVTKTETKFPDTKTNVAVINNPPIQNEKNVAAISESKQPEKKTESVVKTDTKAPDTKSNNVAVNTQPIQNDKALAAVTGSKQQEKKAEPFITKTESKTPDPKPNDVAVNSQKQEDKKANPEFEFTELKRTNRKLKPASALVDGRISEPSETIYFKSDSLVLALYDNGEVDGDTVSVIINDELFIEKQGLKSSAFRRTFYLTPETGDSILLVLFAENLGKYPPNTGLLIVKDGEEQYYVRFKADLDRNAAIVLRRKYKL